MILDPATAVIMSPRQCVRGQRGGAQPVDPGHAQFVVRAHAANRDRPIRPHGPRGLLACKRALGVREDVLAAEDLAEARRAVFALLDSLIVVLAALDVERVLGIEHCMWIREVATEEVQEFVFRVGCVHDCCTTAHQHL